MPVGERNTLLVPSGTSRDPEKKHLHVVCSEPDADGMVLVVGIATYANAFCDETCVLQEHEHPWLRHESYVFYRKAEIVSATALAEGIENGDVLERADVNAQVYLRIKKGFCRSPQTKRKIKRYLDC